MRIVSLNVNGIRSAFRKGLPSWLAAQGADVVCLQEIKIHADDLSDELLHPAGYTGHFNHAQKKGYSGVGLYMARPAETLVDGMQNEALLFLRKDAAVSCTVSRQTLDPNAPAVLYTKG